MRRLCPNFDREDGLDTVLEVPIPEEMLTDMGSSLALRWQNMLIWMKAQTADKWASPMIAGRFNELGFLLYIVCSPPSPFRSEASTAKYIMQQYVAATGGQAAIESVNNMCVIGEVKISASEFYQGDQTIDVRSSQEAGGFVLWQQNPDLWCLEFMVAGCKVGSGSNGKISWGHSSNQQSPSPKALLGPYDAFYSDDCFILKLDSSPAAREAQSGPSYEIIHHTIWGYFSQRSGLLVQFEDSRLLRMRMKDGEDVLWETSAESVIQDYKYVDGVNIAHGGRTLVTVFRYGERSSNHKREVEETWKIEEVNFNIWGLNQDFFMPPSELGKD
uniref:Uncharacterized protein n=1 Tax=Kalanchoe fedtschenkoi TaxID=63787 RepID=A0A7N0UBY2_KALFE